MARFVVTIRGYGPETFEAQTAAGAKAKAFRALREAIDPRITFRDFLGRVSVSRANTVQ